MARSRGLVPNISPTAIATVSTQYDDMPEHRGHTVEVQGWNSEYVMLVIRSGDRTNEALITPGELLALAKTAVKECPKW